MNVNVLSFMTTLRMLEDRNEIMSKDAIKDAMKKAFREAIEGAIQDTI